jgi:hypothetical protein
MKSCFPSDVLLRLATAKRTFCSGVWGTSYFGDPQTSITGADSAAISSTLTSEIVAAFRPLAPCVDCLLVVLRAAVGAG